MAKNSYKESEELIRIGKRIKCFREQANLSLADLSRLSGVPANTLSNIEHGLGLPISLVVEIDDGPLQEIIEESSKEFIRFLKNATDEEILKYQWMTFILQRLSKWKE